MANIYVKLENCYGIQSFEYTFIFDSDKKKAYMIYAPNGIMKTSFANTLKDICETNDTKDCFYPLRKTIRIIKRDETAIDPNSILIIEPYSETYKSENANILLANKTLKQKYDQLHKDIDDKFKVLTTTLSNASGKRDIPRIFSEDFNCTEKKYYACLENLYDNFSNLNSNNDYSLMKYGEIVTTDAEKIFKDPKVVKQLNNYIEQYAKLLTESKIFKPNYNHTNAEDTLKTLNKDGFFKVNHKILLYGDKDPLDESQFRSLIAAEKKRIIDTELSSEFQKIDSLLSAKNATKDIRHFIFKHREIIPELADFDKFKKMLWIYYLSTNKKSFELAILNYKGNKEQLDAIIKEAKENISKWNIVVDQFNERFSNMPFKVKIANKEDVILNNSIPIISFEYENRGDKAEISEENIKKHLSNGEKKALYLLNVIFEIEARKSLQKETLIIMDDIADSFDYRNKYAIIEYIKNICDNNLFMPIILTHNFDFYRTVAGIIGIQNTSKFVNKTAKGIELANGQYFKNVFNGWRTKVSTDDFIFISAIAFVRNLIEYASGSDNINYLNLTSLLHYKQFAKPNVMITECITVQNLIDIYTQHWNNALTFTQPPQKKVIDLIFENAEKISNNPCDEIHIENKIVLSIAIRLYAEKYMINRINDPSKIKNISGPQTRKLKDLINFDKSNDLDKRIEETIERVLIITSENIHINSFMYEPIIDMSLTELINLYNDVKTF